MEYGCQEVSAIEVEQYWDARLKLVEGRVPDTIVANVRMLTRTDNVGYDQGQVRPVLRLSQFDVLYLLDATGGGNPDVLLATGLTGYNFREAERESMLIEGWTEEDIIMMEQITAMSPTERDAEIARLEALLGI